MPRLSTARGISFVAYYTAGRAKSKTRRSGERSEGQWAHFVYHLFEPRRIVVAQVPITLTTVAIHFIYPKVVNPVQADLVFDGPQGIFWQPAIRVAV